MGNQFCQHLTIVSTSFSTMWDSESQRAQNSLNKSYHWSLILKVWVFVCTHTKEGKKVASQKYGLDMLPIYLKATAQVYTKNATAMLKHLSENNTTEKTQHKTISAT